METSGPRYVQDSNFNKVMRAKAVSVSQLETNVCRGMYEWWYSFYPNTPRRNQFDILNHIRAAQNIFLVAVTGDGVFEYRIQGEEVIDLVGSRNAGKKFSVGDEDKSMNDFALFLTEMVEQKSAMYSYG